MRISTVASPSVPRTRNRSWMLVPGLIAICLLIVAGLMGRALLSARTHLLSGERDLSVAGLSLTAQGPARLRIQNSLSAAATEFNAAHGDLAPWSPVLGLLRPLPRYGAQLAAVSPASDAAYHATTGALDLVQGAGTLFSGTASTGRMAVLLNALQAGHRHFARAGTEAALAAQDLRGIPSHTGNATLDRATGQLRQDVPPLQRLGVWLGLAPALLGADGSRHYLLVWQNSAELRATGGFIGGLDWMTVRQGVPSYSFSNSSLPHDIGTNPPLPEALYTPERALLLRDSNWSPDFPLSARLERWFYGEDTGRWADGVVDFVDQGVADILQATGPVYLPAYGRWVTAANVDALAQYYIHGPASSGPAGGKRFMGVLLQTLLGRIQTLPRARWPALGAALSHALSTRNILLYDERPDVERAIDEIGADGRMLQPTGDYLFVVDDNRSYNKINPYVREDATYHLTIHPDSWGEAVLDLRYRVLPSPSGLEGEGPEYGLAGTKHDYEDFLRVYVPPGARLLSMTHVAPWAPQQVYGHTQFAGAFILGPGPPITVRIRYLLPPNTFPSGQYRLTVQRQPGADLHRVTVFVNGGSGVHLVSAGRPTTSVSTSLALASDARLALGLTGVSGNPISLPPNAPRDPYLTYAAFHDRRHPL